MNQPRTAQKPGVFYFLLVATGVFLSTMDSSMINLALPHIMSSFNATLAGAEWVVLIYLLTISVTLLMWGSYSDGVGKGTVYLLGMFVFALGSLFCYFSASLKLLIFYRFIQGSGAAMMMSTGPAIIRLSVPRKQLGRWLGSLGIATSMGLMSGPLISGFLLHRYSWRTIFLLNVPISLTVFLLGWIFLAGTLPRRPGRGRFDFFGALLWGGIIALLVLLFSSHLIAGFPAIAVTTVVLLALMVLFFRHQREHHSPLIPVQLLTERYSLVALVTLLLSFAVLFFALILMPFYLKYIIEMSFDKIGYVMMCVPVTLFVVSPLSGRLYDRMGARYLTFAGMVVVAAALLLLSGLDEGADGYAVAWRLALLGCGQAVFLSPNSASVLARVRAEHTGISAGLLATSRNLGMLFGVALVGLMFSYFFSTFSGGLAFREYTPEQLPHFLRAFRYSLSCAALLAAVNAAVCLLRE